MSENRENAPEKIDLYDWMQDIWKGIQKFWWLVIGLAVILGAKSYFDVSTSYVPQYIASATMAVRCAGNDVEYINAETAEQMTEIFPYIMKSGVLQDAIAEDMGLESMPGSVSMSVEPGTNFFTISANANDAQLSYDLLQATIRQYPEVAKFVIGQIEMEVLDETGVPSDTGKEYVFRGSVRSGAMKGAIIGLAVMFIYIVTRRTVKSRKVLSRIVNLDDMGNIPYVRAKKRKRKGANGAVNMMNERVSQSYLEAIRKLRIKVLRAMETNGLRSVLVTSSIPGEGKTTIATNLAIAIAKQRKHVILVDCDPRNPSVAGNMGEEEEHPGIGAVLRQDVTLDEALTDVTVSEGKLQILYGGKPDSNTVKRLGGKAMKALVEELETRADIVIFDTAPSALLADAASLARNVDAAIYVVKHDYAKKGQIRNGVQSLSMSGTKILGYVFNADRSRRGGNYGYGYGYGYGYKNYKSYYGYGHYDNKKKDDASGRVIKD